VNTISRLVGAGYSILALALIAFLTANGSPGTPAAAALVLTGLFAIGLVLPAAGMLRMARTAAGDQMRANRGLVLQVLGLGGLLFSLVLLAFVSSVAAYAIAGVAIAVAGAAGAAGAALLRATGLEALLPATVLIFLGSELVAIADIAGMYVISPLEVTVYVDIGATVSACGSILAAYSFFMAGHRRDRASIDATAP
jgi:hypothetical protein